jgi:opine dehydrogenase
MRVAVLGGGNGAHAHAGHLALRGHEVCLGHLPERAASIAAARISGTVTVTGDVHDAAITTGVARLAHVTTELGEAVEGADVVMLVIAAQGQDTYLDRLAPLLREGQLLLISPGKFGAPIARRRLAERGVGTGVTVVESESLLYIARLEGPAIVRIHSVKKRLAVAALPARLTEAALTRLCQLHPQFVAAGNVLATSLSDPGNVMHPVHTLLNTGRIEDCGPYRYDHYGVTPSIGRVIDALDRERLAVARALDLTVPSVPELLHAAYGADPRSAADAIRSTPGYRGFMAPADLGHRFITENVPYGLVPIASIGCEVGVPTPSMDAIIALAHAATGHDFSRSGRNATSLGFAGMRADAIRRSVQ